WERCSAAVTVRTVPASFPDSSASTRLRWISSNAVVVARSRLSWTRESAVLTPWPPGPEAWENCSCSSASGTRRPWGAPGPGATRRSSMPPVWPTRRPGCASVGREGRPLVPHPGRTALTGARWGMAHPKKPHTAAEIVDAGPAGWSQDGQTLTVRFATGDFATGLELVDRIGASAEEANHHPDLTLTYPEVTVTL